MEHLYTALLLTPALLLLLKTILKNRQQASRQPPGPLKLPLIGNLHLLLGPNPPHRTLRNLSAKYGPIMRLKLGEIPVVVISSADGAAEIMKSHDLEFSSRPINCTVEAIFYGGNDVLFGPYGEFWRQMRRLCNSALLNPKRVRSFRAVREEEVSILIRDISEKATAGVVVDLSSSLAEVSNSVMARTAIGGRCENQSLFHSQLCTVVEFLAGFNLVDLFPSMPFIGRITGQRRRLDECRKNLDLMTEKIVEKHREKNRAESPVEHADLTDVLLRIQREGGLQFPLSDDNIKAVITDMLLAGSETMATTMEWMISELIRNPTVLEKVQIEVREALGKREAKLVSEEQMTKSTMSYFQMVIKETLRLHPPVPLLLPRENRERCEAMGYEVPAKTTVMVNAWAIGRDSKYWEDPEEFKPERFEKLPCVDYKGAHFQLLPFGSGRRMCPGMQFGLATVEMVVAHLLCYFDWELPSKTVKELDMTEDFGVTARRKTHLCLLPRPRLPLPAE